MLIRPARQAVAATAVTATAVPIALFVASGSVRAAGGQVICLDDPPPAEVAECQVRAWAEQDDHGTLQITLTAGSGGWLEKCQRPQRVIADASVGPELVDCDGGTKGWYSRRHDCYFTADHDGAQNKDPLDEDVVYPDGVERGDEGAVHRAYCFFEHYTEEWGWFSYAYWFLPPSQEPGPTADPTAGLIVDALDRLELRGPTIGTAPPAQGDSAGLVRLPVWLWNEVDDRNWGTRPAVASAGGITARAEAVATAIVWEMGDGTQVTCDQGVAWQPGMDVLDPPCGHRYARASRDQPDGRYQITAVTTWEVEWSVNGPSAASGTVTLHPESTTSLRIEEIQVLTGG